MNDLIITKRKAINSINRLIKAGVIKNHADLAKKLEYTRGAISEMLNLDSQKNVSDRFILKLEKLEEANRGPEDTSSATIKELVATNKVLLETCANLISQSSGRNITLVMEELTQAVQLKMKE